MPEEREIARFHTSSTSSGGTAFLTNLRVILSEYPQGSLWFNDIERMGLDLPKKGLLGWGAYPAVLVYLKFTVSPPIRILFREKSDAINFMSALDRARRG